MKIGDRVITPDGDRATITGFRPAASGDYVGGLFVQVLLDERHRGPFGREEIYTEHRGGDYRIGVPSDWRKYEGIIIA